MNNFMGAYDLGGMGMYAPAWAYSLLPFLAIWSLFWKGHALWHAAGRRQGWWFVALLVFNTIGILEIIYIFGILKLKKDEAFPWMKRMNKPRP
jgi:hypothetical protein